MDSLTILVGFSCPLRCGHCSVRLNPVRKSLTEGEIRLLIRTVRGLSPRRIHFSGGEPALYIDTINRITAAHPDPGSLSVLVTTSGYFAESVERAEKVLASINNLSRVRMSCDRFHQEFVPVTYLDNLYAACRRRGIKFGVVMAIESPLDLAFSNKISGAGKFRIGAMKVTEAGAAKKNGLGFKYPCFDPNVFRKRCPKIRSVSYICGKGFSLCCSYNTAEANWKKFVHPTIKAHRSSRFYSLISSKTFGGIRKYFGLDDLRFEARHTHKCALCGYLFDEAIRRGRFKG